MSRGKYPNIETTINGKPITVERTNPLYKKAKSSLGHARYRCNNKNSPDYKWYGAKGIRCYFTTTQELLDEIGLPPSSDYSIDRINNEGHYCHGNVRWALSSEQARNRSDNLKVTINGVTKALVEWRSLLCPHIKYSTITHRWYRGVRGIALFYAIT